MTNSTAYLDWQDLFVNQVAGTSTLFIFISFAVVAFLCVKFKINNITTYGIFALWGLIMAATLEARLLPIIVFLIGCFVYWGISKLIRD